MQPSCPSKDENTTVTRLGISENNKEENFRAIMTGNLPKEHAQAVYKVIHEMYEKKTKGGP